MVYLDPLLSQQQGMDQLTVLGSGLCDMILEMI